MTAYEGVLNFYIFAMKTFKSSFAEVDEMNLDLLLDLINVEEKITNGVKNKVFIDDLI